MSAEFVSNLFTFASFAMCCGQLAHGMVFPQVSEISSNALCKLDQNLEQEETRRAASVVTGLCLRFPS